MIANGVIEKGFARANIALQEKMSAHWILLHGSDNNIKTVPLALVHLLVRLVPLILLNGRIVVQFESNQRIEPIMLPIVNRGRQGILSESLPLLDQQLVNQVQRIVLFGKFQFWN
jgi:hypothetical protein